MRTSRFWQSVKYIMIGALGMALTIRLFLALTRPRHSDQKKDAQSQSVPLEPVSTHLAHRAYLQTYLNTSPLASTSVPGEKGSVEKKPGRTTTIVGVAMMLAVIVGTFLYSGHIFAGVLFQSNSVAAAQPQLLRPTFERGIIYPQWSPDAYGAQDTVWQHGIGPVKQQTGAQWIELPVLFSQASPSSTVITTVPSTPTISSFIEGIQWAHTLGYKVFFVPLMQVRQTGMWSGSITFSGGQREQAWFDAYWKVIEPYVAAAAAQHVEQMAVGTELQTLQQIVPDALWNRLIARVRGVYGNTLTYDMNWSSLVQSMPGWLENPALSYIGVSTYIPLLNTPGRVDPAAMPVLWRDKVKSQLDALAVQLKKPVLITEIGYRNSADALYRTWEATSKAHADPQEQAGAYEAALSNAFSDTHIAGTFFWGWDNVGMFAIKNQSAVQELLKWYSRTTTQTT
ncbi:MAG TPA: hypothetical protein VGT44_02580 [Ktedonobacteraceae bacterium]|nr:hypothetical protein [Ktedonobacteraceae bacterium]